MNKVKRLFIAAIIVGWISVLLSFVLGASFGAFEEGMKDDLKTRAYNFIPDDEQKANELANKSWRYYQRAHLHSGVLGGISVAFGLSLYLFDPRRNSGITALAFSLGALLYGIFWLLAGLYAPDLGSTDAAKKLWKPIAIPATILLIASLISGIWSLYLALRKA